jgi:hypothetical protein
MTMLIYTITDPQARLGGGEAFGYGSRQAFSNMLYGPGGDGGGAGDGNDEDGNVGTDGFYLFDGGGGTGRTNWKGTAITLLETQ